MQSMAIIIELSLQSPCLLVGGMVSQPGKLTNPFDMAFESDVEANDMFMDLTSLQTTLPDPHVPTENTGNLTGSWISHNSSVPYIPSASQGGLSYMTGQVQDSHMFACQIDCTATVVQICACNGAPFAWHGAVWLLPVDIFGVDVGSIIECQLLSHMACLEPTWVQLLNTNPHRYLTFLSFARYDT